MAFTKADLNDLKKAKALLENSGAAAKITNLSITFKIWHGATLSCGVLKESMVQKSCKKPTK